jgi:acyl dehydratase
MLRIRLSDPAAAAAYASVVFAVLVLIFPASFPRMLADGWFTGRLTPALIVIAGLMNAGIYLRVAHLRSAKPGLVGSAVLGVLTALTLAGLMLLESQVVRAQISYASNPQAYVTEEILAHTYFGLISGLFIPYLFLRFAQGLKRFPL